MIGTRTPLMAKLAMVLLALGAIVLAIELGVLAPRAGRRFQERCQELVAMSDRDLRELVDAGIERSARLLVAVLDHGAQRRGAVLEDLPLSLYGGDTARIRAAIVAEDRQRSARRVRNVSVLAAEMRRRAGDEIDRRLRELTRRQRQQGTAFAREHARTYVLLSLVTLVCSVVLLGGSLHVVVVRPLRRLRGAVRRVAEGDLNASVGQARRDEVGELAADFERMLERLRRSERELAARNAELAALNQRLEAEVARKTAHLERALADLRGVQDQLVQAERMAALWSFAGGVAHEFNNLMGGIVGCVDELAETSLDREQREAVEIVRRAATRAAHVTRQLLRFARAGVGRKQPVALAEVVRDVCGHHVARARRQHVDVKLDLDEAAVVPGDREALRQVVDNLVTNALQAMPSGGPLRVELRRREGRAVLVVEDRGVGIRAEHLERVFEPFWTTKDREADPERRGTGLGLAVAHGIVRAHGGDIVVRSEPGRGTTFEVRLPIQEKDDDG